MELSDEDEGITEKLSNAVLNDESLNVLKNGPTNSCTLTAISHASTTSKPVLIRQDRTYLASPQLSTGTNLGGSEESADDFRIDEQNRSAPDIFQHSNPLSPFPQISISSDNYHDEDSQNLSPLPPKCRTCRRSSTSPASIILLDRSISKDSFVHGHLNLKPNLLIHHHSTTIPPVLVTSSPSRSTRIIRQSSQPDPSMYGHSSISHQTVSLSQLKNPSDAIAEIAGEALKVHTHFKMSGGKDEVLSHEFEILSINTKI